MTITELLSNTGNAGVKGMYTLILTNGKTFAASSVRHPYGDMRTVGFSGPGYGEIRVETKYVASIVNEEDR